jgi:AcrR family transcriptional regulator
VKHFHKTNVVRKKKIVHSVNMVRKGDRRSRRRDARREELLEAAMGLVARHGLDGLTVTRLAEARDTAVSGLYRYFPSKSSLLVALQEHALGQLRAEMAAAVEERLANRRLRAHDPRGLVLRDLLVALKPVIDLARTDPARHRLLDELISTPATVLSVAELRAVNEALEPLLAMIEGLLDAAVAEGALSTGSGAERTRLLWAALHGLDHFRKRDRVEPYALHVERLVRAMLRTLLLGWGAPPRSLDGAIEATLGA